MCQLLVHQSLRTLFYVKVAQIKKILRQKQNWVQEKCLVDQLPLAQKYIEKQPLPANFYH